MTRRNIDDCETTYKIYNRILKEGKKARGEKGKMQIICWDDKQSGTISGRGTNGEMNSETLLICNWLHLLTIFFPSYSFFHLKKQLCKF